MEDLDKLREDIDKIDSEIALLLRQRFKLGIEVLKIKKEQHLKIFQPDREKEILRKIKRELRPVFKEIIKQTRNIQLKKWK